MTEIIKKDTDYGMRMLVFLAAKRDGEPVTALVLAKTQQIPLDFAYKILQKLTRAGLTRAVMGAHGGFRLGAKPEDITLMRVVSAIQGPPVVRKCCLDIEACPRRATCASSVKLGELQATITKSLENITLQDIIEDVE